MNKGVIEALVIAEGKQGVYKDDMQYFQIKITKHSKTGQYGYFL